ncbi:bacteriohemerythrin [Candidatus Accumulibacter phosphatis]|nr:hemerythrin family protein [Candidatus Accumulibacter phosphatis]
MTFINWSPHFVTGIELVDRQHHGLVDLINAVAPLLARQEPVLADEVEILLDRLAAYAVTHFRDEEQLMGAAGMGAASIGRHVTAHRGFVEEIGIMRRAVDANGQIDGGLLLRFLGNWLIFHILVDDQLMATQLRLIASGFSACEAATRAGEAKVDSAQAVLSEALIDLFGVVSARNRSLLQVNEELQAARSTLVGVNASLEKKDCGTNLRTDDQQ